MVRLGRERLADGGSPLVGGTVVLVAFLVWARWDGVFRDPGRLPLYGFLWVPMGLFAVGFVIHLLFVDWGKLTTSLLGACIVAAVLVGFSEEVLFRGVILRALRTDHRAESWVVLVSSLWFGLFHLTNIINGSPPGSALIQVVLASATGAILYLFRRWTGVLLAGMVAHGLWDFSLFLPGSGSTAGALIGLALSAVLGLMGLVVVIAIIIRERRTAMTPTGVVSTGAAAIS